MLVQHKADLPPPAGRRLAGRRRHQAKLRESANPFASPISVQFQNNLNFGFGPNNAAQNDLNFQPIVPFHLNDDWNPIIRWVR